MCVPGLAAYLRAAEPRLSDTKQADTEQADTKQADTELIHTELTDTGPSEEPRRVLVSASGTTDTEGRA